MKDRKQEVIEILAEGLAHANQAIMEKRNYREQAKALYARIAREFPEEAVRNILTSAHMRGQGYAIHDKNYEGASDLLVDLKRLWEGTAGSFYRNAIGGVCCPRQSPCRHHIGGCPTCGGEQDGIPSH